MSIRKKEKRRKLPHPHKHEGNIQTAEADEMRNREFRNRRAIAATREAHEKAERDRDMTYGLGTWIDQGRFNRKVNNVATESFKELEDIRESFDILDQSKGREASLKKTVQQLIDTPVHKWGSRMTNIFEGMSPALQSKIYSENAKKHDK